VDPGLESALYTPPAKSTPQPTPTTQHSTKPTSTKLTFTATSPSMNTDDSMNLDDPEGNFTEFRRTFTCFFTEND